MANYRQFQNNFLAKVIVGMVFHPVNNIESHTDQWNSFVSELFSIPPQDGIFQRPIAINRSDNKLGFVFDKDRAMVLISDDSYQNFADSVIPHAYKLKRFVTEVAEQSQINQLEIRKIDLFQIEAEEGNALEETEVRKHFFSESYLSHTEDAVQPQDEELKFPGIMKHQWNDGEHLLTIRSVFVKLPNPGNKYRLILDTEEQYNPPKSSIDLNRLDKELKEMNKDLFNAFMWCVSDRVTSIMEKGKE